MSKVMAGADFIQVDATYEESSVLPYLFNATAFDEVAMKWTIIARMRCNKENTRNCIQTDVYHMQQGYTIL